jgi:hypothetical protein
MARNYSTESQANRRPLFLQLVPYITAEYGMEARFIFMQKDGNVSQDDFFFSLMLQLSHQPSLFDFPQL